MAAKIKKGDTVVVLSGKDRGKQGKVLGSVPKDSRVVVEGINMVTCHVKPRKQGETGGIVKLIADSSTGEIIGGHMICSHATDMIMEIGILMGLEGLAEDIAEAVHPHPTVSESIMEAASAVLGKAIHF